MAKSMSKSIKVVQFLHSGKEYKRSEFIKTRGKTIKPWNTGDHKRKFLHAKGAYVDEGKIIGNENNWEDIYFWGEWEPESIVQNINKHGEDAPSHFIHEPFLRLNESKQRIKGDKNSTPTNTDPFVFGDKGFFYSCCKQNRKYKDKIYSTQMQYLEPGSIILFGSRIKEQETGDPYFALDTVFVVGEDKNEDNPNKQGYSIDSYSKNLTKVPDNYFDIMNFEGWKDKLNSPCNSNEKNDRKGSDCTSIKSKSEDCENGFDFTCYRGASYDHKVNEMYSFVPCKLKLEDEKIFERVMLSDKDFPFISNNLTQGVKYTESNIDDNLNIWKELCNIIKSQGFEKAVRLNYK